MKVFCCKGCGEIDSIVEFQLIPSAQRVMPEQAEGAVAFEDVDYGASTNYDEDPPVVGFACTNEACRFWHGVDLGYEIDERNGPGPLRFKRGRALQEIAAIVEVK